MRITSHARTRTRTRAHARALATAALALAPLAGCWSDERPIAWERPRAVLGPIPLKAQVAYVDSALDRVTLVDLAGDEPRLAHRRIGRAAIVAVPTPDRHGLVAITRGEEAIAEGQIDEPPQLWAIDPDADPSAPAVGYPIGSPFDRVALAPDSSIAIAYFSAAGPDAAGFFRNPNELAIVDLRRPPGADNPHLETIRSFGSVPEGIVLSPPIAIPGAADPAPRTLAFVLSADTLTVLDASHPGRREISIRLDLGGPPVTPREIAFAPGAASAYVRSDNASDVLQVALEAAPVTGADGNDFRPLLAQVGAGGGPTDIAVYDDPFGRRVILAATPGTHEIVVIDAATAELRTVPIADPIDRILLFPTSGGAPTKALFASIGAKLPRVHALDLERLADPLSPAELRAIDVGRPVRDVVPVPGRDLAMLVHDDARTVLGLLDMATESTAPLLGVGRLDAYDFSADGSHLIGATAGVARVGFVALDNLHPTDIRLDAAPARVLATATGKVFVDHGAPLGHATILPSPDARRADARVLEGFLTADLLDEEP